MTSCFNIDAKSDAAIEPLATMVRRFGALDRVCLASFTLRRLHRLRALLGPGLLTNLSPAEVASLRVLRRLPGRSKRVAQVPRSAGPVTVVDERFITTAHRRGVAVHVWTVNDRSEIERLLDLGVDGIMSDETALLRDVYVERRIWPT